MPIILTVTGKLGAGISYKEYADSDDKCRSGHSQHFINLYGQVTHNIYHMPCQGGNRNVQKETYRHMVGSEVYTNHCTYFQIDKQQQEVTD